MLMLYNFSDIIVSKLNLPVILLVLLSHCTFANAICKHSLLRGIYVILGRKLEIECYPLKRCCFDLSNTSR
jgi:hypothetical protein